MSSLDIFDCYESEARTYCRSIPALFTHAEDSFMFNQHGEQYIDFIAGAGALNYGHNNAEIKQAIIEYLSGNGVVLSLDMHTEAKKEFISTFQNKILAPRQLDYKLQFTSPTGTSVVESAIKLARKYTNRYNVICFTKAFHGMTATSLGLTGNQDKRQAYPIAGITRMPFDNYLGDGFDTAAYCRKLIEDKSSGIDLPAAIILETIQGEGGVNVASVAWLRKIRKMTKELGILLIIDDVQTGCGRTGNFFSFERAEITPDLVCLSKSIGAIGFPFALLLMNRELDVWSAGEDNGTFRGNNLAFIAATKMIDLYWSDDKFSHLIRQKELFINEFLTKMTSKYGNIIKTTRGVGFMQGIEFKNPVHTQSVIDGCFANKLLIESCGADGEVLKLMPALTISIPVLENGLKVIEQAIAQENKALEYKTDSCIEGELLQ
jgi:diaminobutyrate-2-oxoglutarate transaminase